MKKNMGNADRIIRILIAIVITILYFTNIISGTVAMVLLAFSAAFIITSFTGSCPLYFPLGIRSTQKVY